MIEEIKEWIRWEPAGMGKIRRDNKQIFLTIIFSLLGSWMWVDFFHAQTIANLGWGLFGSIWFYHAYKEWNFNR